jgi:hypothetical protein
MAEKEQYIGKSELRGKPDRPLSFKLKDGIVKTRHLEDGAVTTPKIKDKAVTSAKLSRDVQSTIVLPPVNMLDRKYQGITDELYSMVRALQVGGVALSQKLGNREDIGISQKSLTDMFIRIWNKMGEMTGECYMGFSMVVEPTAIACEGSARIHVTADSSGSISNFDYIKIYANEVLKAEGMAVETFDAEFDIDDTSIIKCVAVIAGRTFTKQEKVTKYMPFFIGSGQAYQDIMNEDCMKDLDGTLEGSYDMTVRSTGDHIFIIIPASRKQEFRRADMNGLGLKIEIPMTASEYEGFVVYKSINTYQEGTYNIDIDINS